MFVRVLLVTKNEYSLANAQGATVPHATRKRAGRSNEFARGLSMGKKRINSGRGFNPKGPAGIKISRKIKFLAHKNYGHASAMGWANAEFLKESKAPWFAATPGPVNWGLIRGMEARGPSPGRPTEPRQPAMGWARSTG